MSRDELAALAQALAPAQEAQAAPAPLRTTRWATPAGHPARAARGCIAADTPVLRKLCTQDTLADLFEVSRRTIGDVVREVGPILAQHGFTPTPAGTRFGTAAALLAALADEDTPTPPG